MSRKRRKGDRYKPDPLEVKERRLRKKARDKIKSPLLVAKETGKTVVGPTRKKRKGRVIVHFYGWQIFARHMKSASEFRVVLPRPLSNEEILKRMEVAFGDL